MRVGLKQQREGRGRGGRGEGEPRAGAGGRNRVFGALLHGTLQLHSVYRAFADHMLVKDGRVSAGVESEELQAPAVLPAFSVSNACSLLTTGSASYPNSFAKGFCYQCYLDFSVCL